VTLHQEGDTEAKTWTLTPDAEIKINGWWGRLEQLRPGDRVWAWFMADRSKKPKAVFMLADEPSEQEIHGGPLTVTDIAEGKLIIKTSDGKPRTLKAEAGLTKGLTKKSPIFLQTESSQARLIYSPKEFELMRQTQRTWLRQRWLDEGLPGTLGFVHVYSGEADLILDHETMRWARSLKNGAKVKLQTKPPINAVVKSVVAQREKTQVRLVAHSLDLADLQAGRRLQLLMTAPADDVESAVYPPDIDAPRSKPERIDWFLANIYCTCGVGGDICTGHFYTLASCNPNGCALPNATRQELTKLIDSGLTDRQIFDRFLKDRGTGMLRPHLRP
jgi:hypothetical protein